MTHKLRSSFLIGFLLFFGNSQAQEVSDTLIHNSNTSNLLAQNDQVYEPLIDPSYNTELETVVVTGTYTPKTLKEVPIITNVVTRKDINATDASNIRDILESELPGVEFSTGMNGSPVINIQGMGGNDVLFLIDGERMAGETLDNVDYDRLNMDNVERVEIVKGTASAMYGSGAIGGVVNIITKDADKPRSVSASTNYRKHNDLRTNAEIAMHDSLNRWNSMTSVSYKNRDTYQLQGTDKSSAPSSVWGVKNVSLSEKLRFRPNEHISLTGKGGYYIERIDKTSYKGYDYFHQGSNGGLKSEMKFGKNHLTLSYAFDRYVKDYKYVDYDLPDQRKYENNRHSAKMHYGYHFNSKNQLNVGANYEYEYLLSDQFEMNFDQYIREKLAEKGIANDEYYYEIVGIPFKTHRQHSIASFIQHDFSPLKKFNIVYGLGIDYNSDFGANVSPKLNIMNCLGRVTLRASYAKGFRAPNLKELYMDYDMGGLGMFRIMGNKDLKSETSNNFSLSAEYNYRKINFTVNGFYHNKHNCIEGRYNVARDTMLYVNVGKVHYYGYDASLTWSIGHGFRFKANYTFIKNSYSNVSFSTTRPHSGTAHLYYRKRSSNKFYELNVALSGTIKGKNDSETISYDSVDANEAKITTTQYPAYSIWKLNTSHSLGKHITLTMGLDNLFNYIPEKYDLVSSQSDGITIYGGVKIMF